MFSTVWAWICSLSSNTLYWLVRSGVWQKQDYILSWYIPYSHTLKYRYMYLYPKIACFEDYFKKKSFSNISACTYIWKTSTPNQISGWKSAVMIHLQPHQHRLTNIVSIESFRFDHINMVYWFVNLMLCVNTGKPLCITSFSTRK